MTIKETANVVTFSFISFCFSVKAKRLTLELTGRGHNVDIVKFSMKDMLTRAPVQ
jgi:hypothetical protein